MKRLPAIGAYRAGLAGGYNFWKPQRICVFVDPAIRKNFSTKKGGHNFYLKAVPFLEGKHEIEESNSFQRSQQRKKLSGSVTLTSASTVFDRPLYRRRLTEGFDPSKATYLKERRHEIDQTRLLYGIKKTKRSTVRGREEGKL